MSNEYYYLSTGDKNGFYTLVHHFIDFIYSSDGCGNTESTPVHRDNYIRNLSTDRAEAIAKAIAWADEVGIPASQRRFNADFDLDEINRISREQAEAKRKAEEERIAATDWNVLPFGKYAGQKLTDLINTDRSYVAFVAGWNSGDGQHCAKVANELIAPFRAAEQEAKSNRIKQIACAFGKDTLADLRDGDSDFAKNVVNSLLNGIEPSPKAIRILIEIAAKLHGRRNSKAYNAEVERIESELPV